MHTLVMLHLQWVICKEVLVLDHLKRWKIHNTSKTWVLPATND